MSRRIARLKPKKVKARVSTLKALPYKGHMVYIRRITSKNDNDIFEYILVFKEEVYSAYIIISPRKGQTKLTNDEIAQCGQLMWAGAESTLNMLMGEKLEDPKADVVKAFEGLRKSVDQILPN